MSEIVAGEDKIESVLNKQGFSKLISVYHPDRIQYYHNELDKFIASRDPGILHRLEHVLLILNIEEIVANIDSMEDIDYYPEFKWDVNEASFTIFTVAPKKSEFKKKPKPSRVGCTFYDAVKVRMYGNTYIEFPSNYFEDMDEIEMAEILTYRDNGFIRKQDHRSGVVERFFLACFIIYRFAIFLKNSVPIFLMELNINESIFYLPKQDLRHNL